MKRQDLARLLSLGKRKELGRSREVSAAMNDGDIAPEALMEVLELSANHDVVVAHGMHALRTALEANPRACRQAITWLHGKLHLFDQWGGSRTVLPNDSCSAAGTIKEALGDFDEIVRRRQSYRLGLCARGNGCLGRPQQVVA